MGGQWVMGPGPPSLTIYTTPVLHGLPETVASAGSSLCSLTQFVLQLGSNTVGKRGGPYTFHIRASAPSVIVGVVEG